MSNKKKNIKEPKIDTPIEETEKNEVLEEKTFEAPKKSEKKSKDNKKDKNKKRTGIVHF